jgi:hypothetical protein
MSRIRQKMTYANVVSTICLVLVVGGGSAIAAGSFGKETIPNRALKKESIGPGKLTKAAKAALEGPAGPKGATGPAGPAGPAGAAGSAVAYAHVNDDGSLDAANSKNIASTKLTAQPGYYCVLPSVPVKNVIASGYGGIIGKNIAASFEDPFTSCPDGAAVVEVEKPGEKGSSFTNGAFYIIFN